MLAGPILTSVLASASTFVVAPLVSDQAGAAPKTDSDLVNAWGLAQAGDSAPVWVSDNGSGKSTFYDRSTGAKFSPVVTIPGGAPTGVVYSGSGFTIQGQVPFFLFDSEAGQITGWSGGATALVAVDESASGTVYKGLAIDPVNHLLFAADFAHGHVEEFDTNYKKLRTFKDGELPKSYAPFNVQLLNGKLYVAFAQREVGGTDEVDGAHKGFIDVFSTSGVLQHRLIANGLLNAPWGMTIAPSGFGTLAGDLLVGNFGDGKINAYNANTGAFIATLMKHSGKPVRIGGLWALDAGPGNKVTFSAGPGGEAHGLLGLLEAR
jgi:uncharacterized protein (TIGR03118 family)